jgi:hypothetical protein
MPVEDSGESTDIPSRPELEDIEIDDMTLICPGGVSGCIRRLLHYLHGVCWVTRYTPTFCW